MRVKISWHVAGLIGQRHFDFFPTGPVPVACWFGNYRCPACSSVFLPVILSVVTQFDVCSVGW